MSTRQPDPDRRFGARRVYYNNFAEHLLNAYNPNMTYPGLPYRWTDDDWRACVDMVAGFGFNVFDFWLVPRLFCRDGLTSDFGREYLRQIRVIVERAHARGIKVEAGICLATVGADWRTYCPNRPAEWAELRDLWEEWTRRLPDVDLIGIGPGDPGGCSLNGCTAETFIDRSIDVAAIIKQNIPTAEIELGTWGPPFFAWGIIEGPPGWNNEFVPAQQMTAWRFDPVRMERAMRHLLQRLPDLPRDTLIAINRGFTPDGNPDGENNAIPWANEIARTHRIQTWDFSLTEGENAIVPHDRLERLFEQRRKERAAAPYSGGICFTMTPKLNQMSLYAAAASFLDPDADPREVAAAFFEKLFGREGRKLVDFVALFETVATDWGNYARRDIERGTFHARLKDLTDLLEALRSSVNAAVPFFPAPEEYRQELLWFARLFHDLSGPAPDYDRLRRDYWRTVYGIYDHLPAHVDPRPHAATNRLINHFRSWQ